MVKIFGKSNIVSSKDYIEKKRRKRLYCDTINNNIEGRYIGKFYNDNTKRLQNATNHSNLLNLTKGMFEHRHYKGVSCYFHDGERNVQTFKYKNSTEIDTLNTIKTTNYDGEFLVTNNNGLSVDNKTKYSKGVEYSSIEKLNVSNLEKDIATKKIEKNEYPIARLLQYGPTS